MDFPVNILIVDDHPENLVAIEAVLSGQPYRLIRAYSGLEALRFLLIEEFAVIVMDVQMPDMDGFDTAKMIRAREKTKYIPIIFLSAANNNYDYEYSSTGYSVGATDYMTKPFIPQIFKSKIEGYVSMYEVSHSLQLQSEYLQKQAVQLEKSNQQLFQAKETAEFASEMKTQLITKLSQEIQAPLNEIMGIANLMRTSSDLPEKYCDMASIIHANSNALLSVINQTLDFTNLDTGRMDQKG